MKETKRQKDIQTNKINGFQWINRGMNIQTEKGGKTKMYKHIKK